MVTLARVQEQTKGYGTLYLHLSVRVPTSF